LESKGTICCENKEWDAIVDKEIDKINKE